MGILFIRMISGLMPLFLYIRLTCNGVIFISLSLPSSSSSTSTRVAPCTFRIENPTTITNKNNNNKSANVAEDSFSFFILHRHIPAFLSELWLFRIQSRHLICCQTR